MQRGGGRWWGREGGGGRRRERKREKEYNSAAGELVKWAVEVSRNAHRPAMPLYTETVDATPDTYSENTSW